MSEFMTDRPPVLDRLEYLGDATRFSSPIRALMPSCALLGNFSAAEAGLFAQFLDVYRCESGAQIVGEGEGGEFMLVVLEGRLGSSERPHRGAQPAVAELGPGATLGEGALIDGEPHRASCVALDASLVAVLHRENLARVVIEQPTLGAKALMALLMIVSARLRATEARLLAALEAPAAAAGDAPPPAPASGAGGRATASGSV
jgi:CRP-like cAMP-binding protein